MDARTSGHAPAQPRPGPRARGPRAGPPGRAADRGPGPDPHHRVGRAGRAPAGRPGRRRRRRHAVGEPARATPSRPPPGWSTASRCPPGTPCAPGTTPTWARWPGPPRPARCAFRVPEGADARAARSAADAALAAGIGRIDAQRAARDQLIAATSQPPDAVDLPHRGHRRHLRGHPAGPGGRAGGRGRHRGDPVDRPVAARLRARGRHPGGLRRHLRDPGELPPDARRPRRRLPRAGPLRPADQLRVRAVHARDRRAGRPGAPRHDAQRLHVRDHLPRHQPPPDVHRPAVLPADPRPGRDRHQHRRGQLPDHRRRRGRRPHRGRQPAAQRVLRQGGRPGRQPARPRPRLRDQPRGARLVRPGAGPRPAHPRAVPARPAEVHAADQAHDRQRLRRLPAGRVLQPGRGA